MSTSNEAELIELLKDVANDAETEGCDGMATIRVTTLNRVRAALGWDLIEE